MRKHNLVAITAHKLSEGEVRAALRGETLTLSGESLIAPPQVGCYDCEETVTDEAFLDTECPGDVSEGES